MVLQSRHLLASCRNELIMGELMGWMTGFGLAAGAGGKAFIPLLALGAFHYTPYFELSDRFAWIASPAVMVVLGVLVLVEILVDSIPELGQYSDTIAYFPKIVAGFLAFAAATGTVDGDLGKLAVSGTLGGGSAAAVHWLRNKIRSPFRDVAETAHSGFGKIASLGEAGASTAFSAGAILVPPLTLVAVGLVGLGAFGFSRVFRPRRKECPNCGAPIFPEAIVCPSCRKEILAGQGLTQK